MSRSRTRTIQIILVAITVILILLILPLIGNIHDIEFLPRRAFEIPSMPTGAGSSGESAGWLATMMLLRVLFIAAALVFTFQLISNREYRRFYLIIILTAGAILLAADFFGCDRQLPEEVETQEPQEIWLTPEGPEGDAPVERDVTASNMQYIILAIVLSTLAVIVGGTLALRWFRSRPKQPDDDGYSDIMESITTAAHRLRAGEDPYTVVLFCYQEMIGILSTAGAIDATYLTPREFEQRLRVIGMSGKSITELTGIFEIVRYSGRVDDSFAHRALACLDAIQEAHHTDEQ